ncbi:MAG: murein hydrolase activator EnvC family protein [Eubacteriales bacterium]|jgi:murein DD-endopeptidase MepM/ murein hydrolase activator NlpD
MKKVKKALVVILAAAFCLALFTSSFFDAKVVAAGKNTTISEDQEELKTLQARLNSIRQKRENLNKSKEQAGQDYENAYAEKLMLENDISLLEDEIEVTTKLIEDYEKLIDSLHYQIYDQQTKIDRLYELYDTVVVYYYKNGKPTDLELLFMSDSISSFLTKKDYVEYMLKYMKQVMNDIDAAKSDLADTLNTYEITNKDLQSYRENLTISKADYEGQVLELEALMAQYGGQMELTKEQIAEFERQAKELERQIAELNRIMQEKITYIEGDYGWPIAADYWGSCRITSPYGYRPDPITHVQAFHNGLDIAAPEGTPVQSVKAGVVVKSEYSESYGNYIMISHGDGTSTLYAHLSKRLVNVNDKVLKGQVIGRVGSTGRSTGNHLHFTVYKGGELDDPVKYLDKTFTKTLDKNNILK